MPAKLSTHVLDTANGCPADGMQIQLWSLREKKRSLLKTVHTDSDGRTNEPLLNSDEFQTGEYELVFHVGNYFAEKNGAPISFLDEVPVRFKISEPNAAYHVPLLVSPWAYSTYRGS